MKKIKRRHKEERLDIHKKARGNINNTKAEETWGSQQMKKILMRGEP